jgi:hypothetical protein
LEDWSIENIIPDMTPYKISSDFSISPSGKTDPSNIFGTVAVVRYLFVYHFVSI